MSGYEPSSLMVAQADAAKKKRDRKKRLKQKLASIKFSLNNNENAGTTRAIRELCDIVETLI